MNNKEQLNQEKLFNEYKEELDFLKSGIEDDSLSSQEIQEIETNFYNGLNQLTNNVPQNYKNKFETILYKLKNPDKTLDSTDIETIGNIFIKLEDTQLEQTDLEKLEESITQVRSIRSSLNNLNNNIQPLSLEKKELKQKYEKLTGKVEKLSKSKPIWTKAILGALPVTMLPLFEKKDSQENSDNTGFVGEIKDMFSTIKNSILVPVYSFLLSLGWGVPNEVKEIYKELKNTNLSNEDIESLQNMGVGFAGAIEGINNNTEVSKEDMENVEANFRASLPDMVKKQFGKDVTDEQVNSIMEKMDFKNLLKDKKNIDGVIKKMMNQEAVEGNYLEAGLESVSIPFEIFMKLTKALIDEDIISWYDVSVLPVKSGLKYGYRSLSLFGAAGGRILGEANEADFIEQVKKLYDRSPDEGKEFLSIFIYKSGGPVFNLLGNIAKYSSSVLVYGLVEPSKLGNSYNIVKESLKGEINTNIKLLKKLEESLLDGAFNSKFQDQLTSLRDVIGQMDENAKLVRVYNNIRNNPNISDFGEAFKKEYKKLYNQNINLNNVFGGTIKDFSRKIPFRNLLIDRFKKGHGLDKAIGEVKAIVCKAFKGINSGSYTLNQISKSIRSSTNTLINTIQDDTLFGKVKKQWSKIDLMQDGVELVQSGNKLKYNFQSVDKLSDFVENLRILSTQAPEALKFLIGKTPIFIVAGLELDKSDTLPENLVNVGKGLTTLIPFVGPFMLLREGADINDLNMGQIGLSGALFTLDGWFAFRAVQRKELLRFMAMPFIDVAELIGAVSRSGYTIGKFAMDGTKIAKNPKALSSFLSKTGKTLLKKPGSFRKIAIALIVLGAGTAYASLNEDDIPEEIKEAQDDPKKLEKIVEDSWGDLDIEGKKEIIKLAVFYRLGLTDQNHLNDIEITDKRYLGEDEKGNYAYDENKMGINLKGDLEKLLVQNDNNSSKVDFSKNYYIEVRQKIYDFIDNLENKKA